MLVLLAGLSGAVFDSGADWGLCLCVQDDLSQLSAVRMTGLDAAGFTADVVTCDEASCVCVQERLEWPLGLCHSANDVIEVCLHSFALVCWQ